MRLLGLLCALVACSVLAEPRAAFADSTPTTRSSAVIVSSHIANHRDAIGAGVIVAVRPYGVRIVTAKHVADAGAVTVWIDHTPYPAEIVRTFPRRDLAVVDALVPRRKSMSFRPASVGSVLGPGEAIDIWGENDAGPRLERGTLVTARAPGSDDEGADLLGFECTGCRPGDSGAGVFDSGGRLLGVLTARLYTVDDRTVMLVAEPIDPTVYETGSAEVAGP